MILRQLSTLLLLVFFVPLQLHAQRSAGLDMTSDYTPTRAAPVSNSWGQGAISSKEGAVDSLIWQKSDGETLLPIFIMLKDTPLSSTGQDILRRIVLSPTRAPANSSRALEIERAALVKALSGDKAYGALLKRFPYLSKDEGTVPQFNAQQLAEDELYQGNYDSACALADTPDHTEIYWLKLRALCFAIKGEAAAAEITLEVASSQGDRDAWLIAATKVLDKDTKAKPHGRFDTGIYLTATLKAGLSLPANILASVPRDRYYDIARNSDVAPNVMLAAAERAYLIGDMDLYRYRSLIETQIKKDSDENALFKLTGLSRAYKVLMDASTKRVNRPAAVLTTGSSATAGASARSTQTLGTKAEILASVLEAYDGHPQAFYKASHFFKDDILKLTPNSSAKAHATLFARACLALKSKSRAQSWQTLASKQDRTDPALSAAALLLESELLLLGDQPSARQLSQQMDKVLASKDLGHSQKESVTGLALGLFDYETEVNLSSLLALAAENNNKSILTRPSALRLAIREALKKEARGELALIALLLLEASPEKISAEDLSLSLEALRKSGFSKEAEQIASEVFGRIYLN